MTRRSGGPPGRLETSRLRGGAARPRPAPGGARVHKGCARGQRGAKAQPLGSAHSAGTVPGISAKTARSLAALPSAAPRSKPRSPSVYGCCGESNRAVTGAVSTIRPAYITATRSAVSATTPRSWVMRINARPSRARSRKISRICACVVTSRAVVGSSAITRSGSQAIAMAIMARWRIPPDIWCG